MPFACAAVAIHLMRRNDGGWMTVKGVVFGLLGFAAGVVLALVLILVAAIVGVPLPR